MRDRRGSLGTVVGAEVVVECWWRFLAPLPPWDRMPADDAYGMMRRVIDELLDDGQDVELRARCVRLMLAARDHGLFRRAQQCRLGNLAYEIDAIEDGLLAALGAAWIPGSLARDILRSRALEMRLIRDAAVRGWNQC